MAPGLSEHALSGLASNHAHVLMLILQMICCALSALATGLKWYSTSYLSAPVNTRQSEMVS